MTSSQDLLSTLPTPAIILDRQRLQANCARMARRVADAGVMLRPHLKTAKSADVARVATAGQFGGITVSTLAELAYFLDAGFRDITYAVGIVPTKMTAIERFMARGASVRVILDSVDAVGAIAVRDGGRDKPVPVLIEIDCGGHRAGVRADSETLIDIAKAVHAAPGLVLDGVLTHAGHSYHAASEEARCAIAIAERDAAVLAATRIREAGIPCKTVSIGSTPTALTDIPLDGVTEIRPGVYVFFDLSQARLGVCSVDDIAVSVLATVIGHHREAGHLLVDAGALALSKDISANEHDPHIGYGLVCDIDGKLVGGLYVGDVHQEHGFIRCTSGALPFERFPVGSRVRILPNHACMTVAPYDEYHVLDTQEGTLSQWSKTHGW
ncbi:MAG TPA: alanine racemase [Noviherbaspirillum sp.]|nr:alanine racemase [Noviherbaspirillum sp.]